MHGLPDPLGASTAISGKRPKVWPACQQGRDSGPCRNPVGVPVVLLSESRSCVIGVPVVSRSCAMSPSRCRVEVGVLLAPRSVYRSCCGQHPGHGLVGALSCRGRCPGHIPVVVLRSASLSCSFRCIGHVLVSVPVVRWSLPRSNLALLLGSEGELFISRDSEAPREDSGNPIDSEHFRKVVAAVFSGFWAPAVGATGRKKKYYVEGEQSLYPQRLQLILK